MGGQATQMMLDVDGGEVAHHQGAGQILVAAFLPDGAGHHGHGAGDALIAAARIAHDGHHDPGHAGVGRCGGQTDGEGGQVIGKDVLADYHLLCS